MRRVFWIATALLLLLGTGCTSKHQTALPQAKISIVKVEVIKTSASSDDAITGFYSVTTSEEVALVDKACWSWYGVGTNLTLSMVDDQTNTTLLQTFTFSKIDDHVLELTVSTTQETSLVHEGEYIIYGNNLGNNLPYLRFIQIDSSKGVLIAGSVYASPPCGNIA